MCDIIYVGCFQVLSNPHAVSESDSSFWWLFDVCDLDLSWFGVVGMLLYPPAELLRSALRFGRFLPVLAFGGGIVAMSDSCKLG